VAFSVLNLLVHFQGFSSFLVLVFYKLPLSAHGSPHYEYVSLWAIYGLLSMNSWIWSTVFHSRLVHVTSSFLFDSKPHVIELPTCSSELTETPGRLETFSTHSFHGCLALAKTDTIVRLQNMFLCWTSNMGSRGIIQTLNRFSVKHPQLRCVDFPFITSSQVLLG
jgi:hypothetical protein